MISTVDDLLVYGRALGTGEGLLPPEQQAQRLDSFLGEDILPNNADKAYGLGFVKSPGGSVTPVRTPVLIPPSTTAPSLAPRW